MNKRNRSNKAIKRKERQLALLKAPSLSYGGILLRTRRGRSYGRPLATRTSIHLVLRSSKATGSWSFRQPKNKKAILRILKKFAQKYSVKIQSMANVGNHLHIHLQLMRRDGYRPFIRAITGAIAMAVTGASRWRTPDRASGASTQGRRQLKFWDYRPFTRIVQGFRAVQWLRDYIQINFWESQGLSRPEARERVYWRFSTA